MKRTAHFKVSRRQMLGVSLATPVAASLGSSLVGKTTTKNESKKLPITITGYPYERVKAIKEGQVKVAGCEVSFEQSKIGEMNRHIFSGPATRDITEVGLIPFLLAFCNDDFRKYQLLPVFVLKLFRHKSIFVRTDGPIKKPEDLRGRRVATVGYSSSGLTWVRGVLYDEYGVKPEEIQWVKTEKDSAANQTGGVSKWEKQLPKDLKIEPAPEGKSESDLLLAGDVDAVFHPAEPQAFVERDPRVKRLFDDPRSVEQAYFKKTGIFPIMHTVAIRRDLAEANPWLAKAAFEAYSESKQQDYSEMQRIRWAYSSLPWFGQEYEETRELMGDNYYSYGIPSNRKALETVFRYLKEQGLAKRQLSIRELFEESTLNLEDKESRP